jgi:hypothetical protein
VLRISGIAMATSMALFLRETGCGCSEQEYGPCEYEEVPVTADAVTPWDTRVGDDLAQLLGPYEGIWRWEEDHAALDFDRGGAEIPATATLVLDPDTYRFVNPIYTGHTVCSPESVAADGTMTFTDEQGEVITSFDLTVMREIGLPVYLSDLTIQPVEAFSHEVHTLREYDVEGIHITVYWNEDGSELRVGIEYGAQSELTPASGTGTYAEVAEFTMQE